MLVFGTEMHIVTFLIAAVELAMFFFQLIYFLSRPSDKNRLWYLILLYLLIQYNVATGLLPDENFTISILSQNIIAYACGFLMTIYLPFYIYKAFDFRQLKFFAYWGSFLFLFTPFIVGFIVPYLLTEDILLSRRIVVVVPFLYSFVFCYFLYKSVRKKYFENPSERRESLYKEKIIAVFLALAFWTSLPVILFFEDANNLLEHSMTNAGFLVMTFIYIRSTIYDSKKEYNELQMLNRQLAEKVRERTKQLEEINNQQASTFINLVHETKTPLTLINNYLDEYISKHGYDGDLNVIKSNIDKLTADIVNFFDLERYNKGIDIYVHEKICCFSEVLTRALSIFGTFAKKKI